MIAPHELRVPPEGYGGTELIVSLLTEELVHRGHEVTLFASGDAETRAELASASPRHLRGSSRTGPVIESLSLWNAAQRASEFEILHNHTFTESLPWLGTLATPVLTTLHNQVTGDWPLLFAQYRGWYSTISEAARRGLGPTLARFAGVVHNAIDLRRYPFAPGGRSEFLLYLSRMSPEKGPDAAIEVARRARRRLVLAGDLREKDRRFFRREVAPHVDGEQVRYLGHVTTERKIELLRTASCLLAPLRWDEPFGLFLIEAMACGTPVVATCRGAVPEIIRDGESGIVVPDVAAMPAALERAEALDPRAIRRRVAERFDVPVLADGYLTLYKGILEAEAADGPERPAARVAPRRRSETDALEGHAG
jgi:glycosyltransferase involved in cell wall biosynthesis